MISKLRDIVEGDDEYSTIFSHLRSIHFDYDFDGEVIPYEKYLVIANNVEDAKGNSGSVGQFVVTNLKIMWQLKSDPSVNLVFGLDSIHMMDLKTSPVQWGSGMKHLLTVKAQNSKQSQTRYEFKFVGFHPEILTSFEKAQEIYKKIQKSKSFRYTNLAVKYENQFQPMEGEEVRTTYENSECEDDLVLYNCKVIVTNARVIFIKEGERKMNVGAPWIMIKQVDIVEVEEKIWVRFYFRGLMSPRRILISCKKASESKKMSYQMKSCVELYNKTPFLGLNFDNISKPEEPVQIKKSEEITQIQATKINIVRRKNIYQSQGGLGDFSKIEFNQEIGLMMERLPEGVTRADLWEILR